MTESTPNFHALLIGIDYYFPHRFPNGTYYKNLQGCVRDINQVETFLKNTFSLTSAQIIKLTASVSDDPQQPKESLEFLPTYENIIARFKDLTEKAQRQDLVYIHYSGHGGRAKTIYANLKGASGVDEAIVPTDIGQPNSHYLRDLEFAFLLQEMVDKGLVVTLVLDSCHSGGATREISTDSRIRGGGFIDTTARPTDSLVASLDKLMQPWQQSAANTRNISIANGLLPEPKGYTLIAACRDNESAYEDVFEGTERNGALTYWLLHSLQKLGKDVSVKALHELILAKIRGRIERQTPMLLGERDRTFFGGKSASVTRSIPVMKVDIPKKRVKLQAGEANGIKKEAEFDIYQLGTTDFSQSDRRVATVKVVELEASDCWAEVTALFGPNVPRGINILMAGIIEEGSPALYLGPGVKLVRKICLLPPSPEQQPPGIDVAFTLTILQAVKERVEGHRWLEFSSENGNIDYFVTLNSSGEYAVLDAQKNPINYFSPPLRVGESGAATKLINRLVHLAKYQAILQIDNQDFLASLNGKLKVELGKSENRQFIPLTTLDSTHVLEVGEQVYLRIRNESNQTLNITALVLQPDLSVTQLYPQGADYEVLDAGKDITKLLELKLPENYEEGVYTIKVFATLEGTSFQWLELPAIDQSRKGFDERMPSNAIEQFLAAIADENVPSRNIKVVSYSQEKWTIEQVKVVLKKN